MIDVVGSISDAMTQQTAETALKVQCDLDRYKKVFELSNPDLIIETGTWTGRSALWYANTAGCRVITVDNYPLVALETWDAWDGRVHPIAGSSIDEDTIQEVYDLVGDAQRVMVVLDSNHAGPHVIDEMEAYAKLVSPGCYCVVEDTLARWMPWFNYEGSPMDAVEYWLDKHSDEWSIDFEIEEMTLRTQHPRGWLKREKLAGRRELVATDLDGTFHISMTKPDPPTLCISGRTWDDYDDVARQIALGMPVYIRGAGAYGDREHAGQFKADMIEKLGVTLYYEDDPVQAEIIRQRVPGVKVVLV